MGKAWARRPLGLHRFRIEVDLLCADDLETDVLVRALVQLSTAGLHGMVSDIRSVELDGKQRWSEPGLVPPEVVRNLRPPPDARIGSVLRELESVVNTLRSMVPEARRSEAVA